MSDNSSATTPVTGPEHPSAPTAADRRGSWWWTGLRPLLLRLHFYVGVFVGPFVLLAAVTGLLYAFTPQIERVVHADALTTDVGTSRIELRDQVAAAERAVPDGTITEIRPPRTEDGTTRVSFDAPGVAEDDARTAFVDPYTGDVRAVLDTFEEWLPVRAWFDDLHRTLLLGDVGRVYSELAASWLGVLAVSGLAIWVARPRRTKRVRRTVLPDNSARGRARIRSWHGSIGVWAALGMLFLSATGLTWSQFAGENVTAARAAMNWTQPAVSSAPAAGAPGTDGRGSVAENVDRVLASAREAGLSGPVAITPGEGGQTWSVEQVKRSWPVQQDAVSVTPDSGTIVETLRFEDWPLAAKLARWGIDAHMGLLFGVVNQIALAALAIAIICLLVWGYRMWWLRRPTRPGASTPSGTRKPAAGAIVVVGGAAIVLGALAPVLGVSLLVFLLGDTAWQHLRPAGTQIPNRSWSDDTATATGASTDPDT